LKPSYENLIKGCGLSLFCKSEHIAIGESSGGGSFVFSSRNCKPPPGGRPCMPSKVPICSAPFIWIKEPYVVHVCPAHCVDFKSEQWGEGRYCGELVLCFYPCAPCVSHTVWLLTLCSVCPLTDKRKRAPARWLVLSWYVVCVVLTPSCCL